MADTRQKLLSLRTTANDLADYISTSLAYRHHGVIAIERKIEAVEEDIDQCIRDLAKARGFEVINIKDMPRLRLVGAEMDNEP